MASLKRKFNDSDNDDFVTLISSFDQSEFLLFRQHALKSETLKNCLQDTNDNVVYIPNVRKHILHAVVEWLQMESVTPEAGRAFLLNHLLETSDLFALVLLCRYLEIKEAEKIFLETVYELLRRRTFKIEQSCLVFDPEYTPEEVFTLDSMMNLAGWVRGDMVILEPRSLPPLIYNMSSDTCILDLGYDSFKLFFQRWLRNGSLLTCLRFCKLSMRIYNWFFRFITEQAKDNLQGKDLFHYNVFTIVLKEYQQGLNFITKKHFCDFFALSQKDAKNLSKSYYDSALFGLNVAMNRYGTLSNMFKMSQKRQKSASYNAMLDRFCKIINEHKNRCQLHALFDEHGLWNFGYLHCRDERWMKLIEGDKLITSLSDPYPNFFLDAAKAYEEALIKERNFSRLFLVCKLSRFKEIVAQIKD